MISARRTPVSAGADPKSDEIQYSPEKAPPDRPFWRKEFRVRPAGLGSLKSGMRFGDEMWQDATAESFARRRCCGNV